MAFYQSSFFSSLIFTIFIIPLSALLLQLIAKIFKIKDTSYWTAFKITAILGFVFLFFSITYYIHTFLFSLPLWYVSIGGLIQYIVSFSVLLFLIKRNYHLTFGKTVLVFLVFNVFGLIVGYVLSLLLAWLGLRSSFS